MKRYTLLLTDKTTGTLEAKDVSIGDEVLITLQDENGNRISKTGITEDILDVENLFPE